MPYYGQWEPLLLMRVVSFEGAYMMGNPGHETYKIEIGNPDRSEEFVLMNGRGEVIK